MVPVQPCFMLSCPPSNVARSSAVGFNGVQVTVNVVLPPASLKVKVESISIGHDGAFGCRVNPPFGSENELTKTHSA